MTEIETMITKPDFVGKTLSHENKSYVVQEADNYSYTDPIDGSVATKQVNNFINIFFLVTFF